MNGAFLFLGFRLFFRGPVERTYRKLLGAIVGIGLSLVPLILVLQVVNGMIEGITERYLEVGSFHLQARAFADVSDADLAAAVAAVRSVNGVTSAYALAEGAGILYSAGGRTGVSVRGLPGGAFDEDRGLARMLTVTAGEVFDDQGMMVSSTVAEQLAISPGDGVRLLTALSTRTGRFVLRQSSFHVSGLFTTGYHELDGAGVLIDLARAGRIFQDSGSRSVAVKVEEPFGDIEGMRAAVSSALDAHWYVYTWREMERSMYATFRTQKSLLAFVMALIVCVASVNIASSLHIIALEKEEEIAILRATGAGKAGVVGTFVLAGFLAGCAGTAVGLLLGLLTAVNVNEIILGLETVVSAVADATVRFASSDGTRPGVRVELLSRAFYLDRIPIKLQFVEVLLVSALCVALSTASALLPAYRAVKLPPMEVLRRHG